jgi:hypothetical protein
MIFSDATKPTISTADPATFLLLNDCGSFAPSRTGRDHA